MYLSGRDDHSGVQIRAFIGQQQQVFSMTESNGAFSLRLSPLNHTLTLSANGFISQTLEVQWSEVRQRFESVVNGQSVPLSEVSFTLEINPGVLTGVVHLEG